jgi:hypothetical protein
MAEHGTAWQSMAQHGTAWHSMAQHILMKILPLSFEFNDDDVLIKFLIKMYHDFE